MNDVIRHKIKHNAHRALVSLKWIIFAIIVGAIVGLCGTAFYFALSLVTVLRAQNTWLIFLLPLGGLGIVAMYRFLHNEKDTGTNLVISAIHSDDELPLRMAPLIFVSTLITHLFGGSAGREGAALQMGGSIGNALGKLFRFDDKDKHVMIMCCILCLIRNPDGSCHPSDGNGKRRCHVLHCFGSLRHQFFGCTWHCVFVWCIQ